jgi:arsenical-resistance protein 2
MSAIVAEVPWHALFPGPFSKPALMSVKELHSALLAKASILVVDVRRTDFESAFIKGAINLPAQSFYQTLEGLLPMLSRYERVVFHCSSSNGRGTSLSLLFMQILS